MIWNRTPGRIHLLEGIEGVYTTLCSIGPDGRLPSRYLRNYCSYVVWKPHSPWNLNLGSNWELSFNDVEIRSNHVRSDGSLTLLYSAKGPSESVDPAPPPPAGAPQQSTNAEQFEPEPLCSPLAVYVRTVRERFQSFIEEFSKSLTVESPNGNGQISPELALAFHDQEIRCFSWIKGTGLQTIPLPMELRDSGLEAGMARSPDSGLEAGTARTALELWESKEKVFKLQIDSSEVQRKDCSNQIFQWLIGFYTVVHGVLFTVVSQPDSPFTCGKIRISYILSAIVTFITIAGVVKKLKAMENLDEIMYEHKARLLAVCTWQSNLKSTGREFDFRTAVLDYKPRPVTTWWLLKFLPPKAVEYIFVIVICSAVLCYIMQLVKCN